MSMQETPLSLANTRCVIVALDEAKRTTCPETRKYHLNQAAIYANLAEQARIAS